MGPNGPRLIHLKKLNPRSFSLGLVEQDGTLRTDPWAFGLLVKPIIPTCPTVLVPTMTAGRELLSVNGPSLTDSKKPNPYSIYWPNRARWNVYIIWALSPLSKSPT